MQTSGLKPSHVQVDGGEVAYLVEGDGPPIVVGSAVDSAKPGNQRKLPGFTTITVWGRGLGESSPARTDADYDLWRLVDDLEAVRRKLGIERWAYVGTAQSGMSALGYAVKHQEHLVALVLDSTAASYHFIEDPRTVWPKVLASREWAALQAELTLENYRAVRVLFYRLWGEEEPDALWERKDLPRDFNPAAYRHWLRTIRSYDLRAELPSIHVPTLVLAGERDPLWPPDHGRAIAQAIPHAEINVYDVGHIVMVQAPPGAKESVVAFLGRAFDEARPKASGDRAAVRPVRS